ncbi:hypothetical protein QT711_07295 [Sporosarcina saromensis]|uniref:Lipoprotein n=1 Tax=Sporosarcina saromensis TaxID=359365 RepID=A0ABU4G7N9_9BACL|nr:hypothetical protein [Sporosarcina saromensis]MDW0112986.1 hypothetical protein [Sporosarcina saromensis]
MKKIVGLMGTILFLTGCVDEEAQEFIEQAETIEAVEELVVGAMEQKGLNVSIQQIDYEHHGKQIDTSVIVVDYQTLHEPTYVGRAFVDVDIEASPRKLDGINRLGLDDRYGNFPIGRVLIEQLKQAANQSLIPNVEKVSTLYPGVTWEEGEEKIGFKGVDYQKDKLDELLKLYGDEQFANPSEEQAKQWLVEFEQPMDDEEELVTWLYLQYDGEMTNSKFKEIVQQIAGIDALPKGNYTVRIIADRYDESEEPQYNGRSDGEASNVFIASF